MPADGAAVRRAHPDRKAAKVAQRSRAEQVARVQRVTRLRRVVGALAFLPLIGAFLCQNVHVEAFCAVPHEWWIGAWAILFGSFVGLTIRAVIERRRLARPRAA